MDLDKGKKDFLHNKEYPLNILPIRGTTWWEDEGCQEIKTQVIDDIEAGILYKE